MSWTWRRRRNATAPSPDLSPAGPPLPWPDPPPLPPPAPAAPPPLLDIAAVRRSLAAVTAGPQECAGDFYGHLFAAAPRLRELFPPVMTAQNERLYGALTRISAMLDDPVMLGGYLAQLGADHRKYGVHPEMYPGVGDALLRTLRRRSQAWDDRAEAAWAGAYAVASGMMIAGAQACTGPPAWHGRVLRHRMLARDLAVLDIATDQPFPYAAGQYLTVQHGKWPRVWRQFSVAAPPARDGDRVELHVRQVPGGWVSTALARDTAAGGEVLIGPAAGTMTAAAAGGDDLLLIAGGVGLAPLQALAADILARDEAGPGGRRSIVLYHGARDAFGLYAMPGLRDLEQRYPWFRAVPVVSGDPSFSGQRGNVAEVALEHDQDSRHVYLAGPAAMIRQAASGLRAAGHPDDHVHYDQEALR